MRTMPFLFAYAAPIKETEPWSKAYSYSVGAHALLMLFAIFMTVRQAKVPQTVLTEVKFIERSKVVAVKAKEEGGGAPAPSGSAKAIEGTAPNSQSLKSKVEINSSGNAPLGTGGNFPNGQGQASAGSAIPLSGPIVAPETMGWVGRKQGALIELSHRAGGTVGGGSKDSRPSSGPLQEPIALGKMGLDEIRRKESSIGTPLISQQVATGMGSNGAGSIGGVGKKQLADNALGEKRNSKLESLKTNPVDADKWGKQKGPFSMEGPLKYRKILKMELPPYPRWAEEKGIESSISIRLWVDPKGRVKDNMYLEKTTGYSELDHVAMEALARFVFVPLPSDQMQEDEWGVATFRFELKH